ncbi:uncharacterized protein [Nicotiana sylvestris]|uniref:uncharacterized protein n=1 Tax=Nicotiana sylvestris TaxID=4096 RepID=UPI00388C970C
MQGIGSQMSVSYKDLCLFPDIQVPVGFKIPKFDLYDGHGDPVAHLRGHCNNIRGSSGKDKLLMAYFSQSLSGEALEWYTHQDASRWYTWDDMAQAFARHFQYNIEIVSDRMSLTKMEKKHNESFREYGLRWRAKAARVNPSMEENEMVEYFLQAQEPTYFGHLISAMGKHFNDVVKMGEIVEDGLKSSKIMSYSALKSTTQVIQNNTGSLLGQKEHDDVAMVVSGSRHGPTDPYAKGFDLTVRYMYHSNVQGYSIEDCRALKREIERMIQEEIIVIKDSDREYANPLRNLLTEVNDI